jgi:hypothetical protein
MRAFYSKVQVSCSVNQRCVDGSCGLLQVTNEDGEKAPHVPGAGGMAFWEGPILTEIRDCP